MKNIFYTRELYKVGGIESFEYYLAKYFKNHKDIEIELGYKVADEEQLKQLQTVAKCVKWEGQEMVCDNFFFPSRDYGKILNSVKATNIIECFHMADAASKIIPGNSNGNMITGPKVTKCIAVSRNGAKVWESYTNKKCDCYYPIIDVDKPTSEKYNDGKLHLITCSRLNSGDKGYKRMVKLLDELDKNNIDYVGDVFGLVTNDVDKRFNFRGRELNRNILCNEIYKNDFLVQLSDAEGFGIALAEALNLNVPVISTPIKVLSEHLVNDDNCIIYKFDCSNGQEVINKIKNNKFEFKYLPPRSDGESLLLGK